MRFPILVKLKGDGVNLVAGFTVDVLFWACSIYTIIKSFIVI